MKAHNPVLLDFVAYRVVVSHKGKSMDLKWMYNQAILQSMYSGSIKHLLKKGKVFWGHLSTVTATEVERQEELPSELSGVLQQYKDVFVEPLLACKKAA